jgi:hypothetical protein
MKNKIIFISLLFSLCTFYSNAQEEKPELNLNLSYYSLNNKIPYLLVTTKFKSTKTFEIVKGAVVSVYINDESEDGFLGEVVTDSKGLAKLILPPAIKEIWESSPKHNFIAVSKETKEFAETHSEIEVTKTKIIIDTTLTEEDLRAVSVTITAFDGTDWIPAEDVELKIGIQRLGSFLPVSEEESYTTDADGNVIAEFARDSIPASDENGNIILVVKVEDNDSYGNLIAEKQVNWGAVYPVQSNFSNRSLWATSDKAPLWLLFMAYSIIISVWGVIFYLVYQIFRIKKLGKEPDDKKEVEPPVIEMYEVT